MPRTHLALFQKYRCGTSRRAGPPCSGASGAPSYPNATHAWPPVTSASARFVVYRPSQKAVTNGSSVMPFARAAASSVSSDTPSHLVSNLDHLVTQWMSTVGVSRGSAWNSSHDQRTDVPFEDRMVKSHLASGVRGVGPADRTGKSRVSYWPGGRRPGGAGARRL